MKHLNSFLISFVYIIELFFIVVTMGISLKS